MDESEFSQKAIEAVRRDQQNAENIWVPYVFKDDFYGGTLVIVRFTTQGREV